MLMLGEVVMQPDWYSLLKDFGGWAVVCYVVWWLTKRWELSQREMLAQNREEAKEHSESHNDILRELSESKRLSTAALEAITRLQRTNEQWHEQRSVMEGRNGEHLERLVYLAEAQMSQVPPKPPQHQSNKGRQPHGSKEG